MPIIHERMTLTDARAAHPNDVYFPCLLCGHTWSDEDEEGLKAFAGAHVRQHGYEPGEPLVVGG